jgi:hypothetical protein
MHETLKRVSNSLQTVTPFLGFVELTKPFLSFVEVMKLFLGFVEYHFFFSVHRSEKEEAFF